MKMDVTKHRNFNEMMKGIAMKYGLNIDIRLDVPIDFSELTIRAPKAYGAYTFRIDWSEYSSMTEAAVHIWAEWFEMNNPRDYTRLFKPCTDGTEKIAQGRPIEIKNVIFNDPATIVFWGDGTKTVVKCGEDDIFDPEKGLAMAISKKFLGNQGNYYNEIKKWVGKYESPICDITESNFPVVDPGVWAEQMRALLDRLEGRK